MKRLILLIFLVVGCGNAQNIRDAGCDTVRDWEYKLGRGVYQPFTSGWYKYLYDPARAETITVGKSPAWINPNTLFADWDRWVKACYDDSSKELIPEHFYPEGIGYKWSGKWEHVKDPNDLPGFMEFLKKKYKK